MRLKLNLKGAARKFGTILKPWVKPAAEIAKQSLEEGARQGDERAKKHLERIEKAKQLYKLGKEIATNK